MKDRLRVVVRLAAVLAGMSMAPPAPGQSERAQPISTASLLNRMWSQGQAKGFGPVKLKHFPLRLDDIGYIIPMGLMQSGHTTPSDHLYLVPKGGDNPPTSLGQIPRQNEQQPQGNRGDDRDLSHLYDVIAVADGLIVTLQWRPNPPGGQPDPTVFNRAVDLKVVLEHSATCWSYLDHLIDLADFIRQAAGERLQPGQPVLVRIPVKAGQVIGKVGYQTFDFALIDTTVTRHGFLKPEQFLKPDPWKLHTVDPFDYVDEPLRGKLLALNPRKVAPYGGRIDYDLPGKLVGNWYQAGTGGYAGTDRRWDYWVGHLCFVYHHLWLAFTGFSISQSYGLAVDWPGPSPRTFRRIRR